MGSPAREYDMTARAAATARTRERLLLAARERFADRHYDDVTLAEVAGAAGVTVQTLLNHFGSKEGMLAAAAEAFAGVVADLRGPVEPGDLDGAVDALMRHYEVLGDANWRLVADAERQTVLGSLLDGARAAHRAWIEAVFAPHLTAADRGGDHLTAAGRGGDREETVAALYAVTDVGTWKLLRRDLGRSPEVTRAVLRRLIAGQLERG
ncbi:TetR/AcrR family transcriptional regulator [Agromyces laixinhei]|uniref:TetR/AcrR family transcriptional regulator n=1 Tax=Agromyces laixinhei TaxID=2585717 RepID=UPI001AEFAF05|nr:TetR/AcrR family transcriptional regulator [Agromyces laixinhei]